MNQKMQITLSVEQTRKLLDWAREATGRELEADCLPSGYTLEISVAPGEREYWIEAVGLGRIDLGNVTLDFIEGEDA